jgi:septum site-determining protein MinD
MSRLITIASGKGGVGKTTTSINLGTALNSFGKEVIVVDANLTTPNIGLHLGAPIVPISLNHILNGKAKISDAIYEHESGTKIIPSSLSINDMKNLNPARLKEVGKRLRKMADIVIYDCAAGLGEEALAAMDSADEIIIVTNPEIPAVTDALKTAKMIEQMGKNVRGVIVTRVTRAKTEMPISNIAEMLELPILGVIPEDKKAQAALSMKEALIHAYPKSKAAKAYKRIAARLIGNEDYKEKSGFFSRVFG